MCEQFVARADQPFLLADLWELTGLLERFGIAGFGWGALWLRADGSLGLYRDLRAFRDDPGADDLAAGSTPPARWSTCAGRASCPR